MKDTKLGSAIRSELETDTDDARVELDRRTKETREKLDERADEAKLELGERLFDLGEEYFPEVAQRRRRKIAAAAFGAGVATGAVATKLLDRK